MTMHVDGKQVMEGNLDAFANPAIEAGVVHCRALLEFLGLWEKGGKLCTRTRRSNDVGIEHFTKPDGSLLKMVDPDTALNWYGNDRDEAERALVILFHAANKNLAHMTADVIIHPDQRRLIEIASREVPALVINHLYTPLGLQAPRYQITSRLREPDQIETTKCSR